MVAHALQDVQEARDVRVDVGVRVHQRIAHARLRRQVHHAVELLRRRRGPASPRGRRCRCAGRRIPAARSSCAEPRLLQRDVVVVVEVVDARDPVAPRQQPSRQVEADEPGRAGDEEPAWAAILPCGVRLRCQITVYCQRVWHSQRTFADRSHVRFVDMARVARKHNAGHAHASLGVRVRTTGLRGVLRQQTRTGMSTREIPEELDQRYAPECRDSCLGPDDRITSDLLAHHGEEVPLGLDRFDAEPLNRTTFPLRE